MIHWRRDKSTSLLVPEMAQLVAAIDGVIVKHEMPFALFETWRSPERQAELVTLGYSWDIKGPHTEGKAADYVARINDEWTWKPIRLYVSFGNLVKHYLGNKIQWGGDWKLTKGRKRKDYCHFELPNWKEE